MSGHPARGTLFFAQGFVTAQDRLWHMEYDQRRGAGRWAEAVDVSVLERDKLMRRFRLEASARADYQAVADHTRMMLDAYAAGVNAFIDSTASRLPVEYRITGLQPEPWQPWDGLAVYKVRHILMGVFETKLWRARIVSKQGPERAARLFPRYQPGQLLILPPGEMYSGPLEYGLEELSRGAAALNYLNENDNGSNSWAISGERTASGKPLLAGDSHRALDTPNVYYQNHLACPEFDVTGLSFPGLPGFPHFGHNDWVA
jgi:penicillin amidase